MSHINKHTTTIYVCLMYYVYSVQCQEVIMTGVYSPGGSWMLCILGCPGDAWGSLGGNIWGVGVWVPERPTVSGARGALTGAGVTACCGADSRTVAGDPAPTDAEVDGWLLLASVPIVGPVAPETTAGLTPLFPFKVAPDPAGCIGSLLSVTVAPAAGPTAATLWEFMRGV